MATAMDRIIKETSRPPDANSGITGTVEETANRELEEYVAELIKLRLKSVIEFGETFSTAALVTYLQNLFARYLQPKPLCLLLHQTAQLIAADSLRKPRIVF
jgi:hypothetical protein